MSTEVKTLPNIKSAKKRERIIPKKTLQNQMIKAKIKTAVKKFDSLIVAENKKEAAAFYVEVVRMLDQAAAKHVYHKNTVSRKKSALTLKLNKLA